MKNATHTARMVTMLPPDLLAGAKALSAATGVSTAEVTRAALEAYLGQDEARDGDAWIRESKRRLKSAVALYGPAGATAHVSGPFVDWAVEFNEVD